MGIKDLERKVIEFRDARDWGQYHNPRDLTISLSLEAAEKVEIFQRKKVFEGEAVKAQSFGLRKPVQRVILLMIRRSGAWMTCFQGFQCHYPVI